jgi:hypothetical protein
MVFADAEKIDTELIGQHSFIDDVPDYLGVRQWTSIVTGGDVAERIQAESRCSVMLYWQLSQCRAAVTPFARFK